MEFAIVAFPFFMLLFGVLELGLLFMASTTIDAAVAAGARQVRTGQFQNGVDASGVPNNAADFKTAVCNNMSWISTSDCMANMTLDVRTFASFSAINITPPISNGAIDQAQITFTPGASCDIVLVRAFYPWTLLAPALEPGLPNLGPTQRLLTTAVSFRNENWQSNGPPCN
ncbi:MAG: TadE/TadG family type IV pilus assembly protein [Caulobacterales bacterium]